MQEDENEVLCPRVSPTRIGEADRTREHGNPSSHHGIDLGRRKGKTANRT